ncbi:MAG: alpha/beta hydrolase [Acidimicrobiales bacterium]
MADVTELQLGDVPIRRYRPDEATGAAVVFFHGGGWVVGSRDTHDGQCRYLASLSGATVYNVEYRLAPEHRFPAAFEDAVAVSGDLLAGADAMIDTGRIGVAGDSAGANLAAGVAIKMRGRSLPQLGAQLLIYPALDAAMALPSYREFADGPFLTSQEMRWFYDHYAPGVDVADWRLSPLAADDLSGLPPALVITAENDVLRDEGEAYAQALAAAGVDAAAARHIGATHGFFGWAHAAAPSRAALFQAGAWLRAKLA